MLGLLVQWNVGILKMILFMEIDGNVSKDKEILCRKIQQNNWYINTKSTLGWKQAIINGRNYC